MRSILFIFLGGGLGSVIRYLLGGWISRLYSQPFPLGTLTVNIVACFLAGLVAGVLTLDMKDSSLRLFLITGFCGGFSTFSALTLESANLVSNQFTGTMIVYVMASVLLCLGATMVGVWIAR